MKKMILKFIRSFLNTIVGTKNVEKTIFFIAYVAGIDPLNLVYKKNGILKYWNNEVSGESFVIKNVIKKHLCSKPRSVIFDVGANVGNYSAELRAELPQSEIYAFEPNPNTFEVLSSTVASLNLHTFNLALSSTPSSQKIYTYANSSTSGHASAYRSVLSDLHHSSDILELDINSTTLDLFCEQHQIHSIDFLKIDTEGHELEVLKGAERMISTGRIDIIQFEFNEMNVISRVFLKDFYEILEDYNLFRLDTERLIPLFVYASANEIFQFQNFLAIKKNLELSI